MGTNQVLLGTSAETEQGPPTTQLAKVVNPGGLGIRDFNFLLLGFSFFYTFLKAFGNSKQKRGHKMRVGPIFYSLC